MNPVYITNIIQWLGLVLLGGAAMYLNYNGKLKEQAASLILEAEERYKDVTKAGGIKFNWVVDMLYSLIPAWLRPIFTREMIEGLVQRTFNSVQEYAKLQMDRFFGKVNDGGQAECTE